jgi:hypothetical protein
MLELFFEKNHLKEWKIHPIYLDEFGFPRVPSDSQKNSIINNVKIYNEETEVTQSPDLSDHKIYYVKRIKQFLRLFSKSLYDRNLTNIYLLLMRFFHGG